MIKYDWGEKNVVASIFVTMQWIYTTKKISMKFGISRKYWLNGWKLFNDVQSVNKSTYKSWNII